MTDRKKLIEVALPRDPVSQTETAIRDGRASAMRRR